MHRDLDRLSAADFDLAVIGGGVIGVCIARDAARRGMKVALLERADFANAASEAMSHLIHGGIRYLAQGHLRQVFQSLAERKIWSTIAPDHVSLQPFLMPLIGKSALSRSVLSAGTRAFEMLGRKGAGRRLSVSQTLALEPTLDVPGLQGALMYFDCRIDRPEHLVLAMLHDAVQHGAAVANHAEVTGLEKTGKDLKLNVSDTLSGSTFQVSARLVANVTGPFAAQLASKLLPAQRAARLVASKGIHMVTRKITHAHAIALSGKGEHGFVVPWGEFSLVGTSDDRVADGFANPVATELEIAELSARIIRLLPSAKPFLADPVATFAGIRALPGEGTDTYSASRDFHVADHGPDGASGFYSVYGGKWTTARLIAEQTVDRFASLASGQFRDCDTQTAKIAPMEANELFTFMVETPDDAQHRRSRLSVLASGVLSGA